MTAEGDLRRYRAEANKHREDIAKASSAVAAQRKKAAVAASAAAKTNSEATARTKRAEAERATKAANDAEAKRANLQKKLADIELKITKAQERYEKDQSSKQQKAISELKRRADQAAVQFSGPYRAISVHSRTVPQNDTAHEPADALSPIVADVFLSHASEDKEGIARPLKEALESRGVHVWFDEIRIRVGQSIRREIENGIAQCRFGVVILSPHFFAKQWTQAELDALFTKKMDSGRDSVLPIWHHISKDEVSRHSPLLAGILALNSATMTVEEMAQALSDVVKQ